MAAVNNDRSGLLAAIRDRGGKGLKKTGANLSNLGAPKIDKAAQPVVAAAAVGPVVGKGAGARAGAAALQPRGGGFTLQQELSRKLQVRRGAIKGTEGHSEEHKEMAAVSRVTVVAQREMRAGGAMGAKTEAAAAAAAPAASVNESPVKDVPDAPPFGDAAVASPAAAAVPPEKPTIAGVAKAKKLAGRIKHKKIKKQTAPAEGAPAAAAAASDEYVMVKKPVAAVAAAPAAAAAAAAGEKDSIDEVIEGVRQAKLHGRQTTLVVGGGNERYRVEERGWSKFTLSDQLRKDDNHHFGMLYDSPQVDRLIGLFDKVEVTAEVSKKVHWNRLGALLRDQNGKIIIDLSEVRKSEGVGFYNVETHSFKVYEDGNEKEEWKEFSANLIESLKGEFKSVEVKDLTLELSGRKVQKEEDLGREFDKMMGIEKPRSFLSRLFGRK